MDRRALSSTSCREDAAPRAGWGVAATCLTTFAYLTIVLLVAPSTFRPPANAPQKIERAPINRSADDAQRPDEHQRTSYARGSAEVTLSGDSWNLPTAGAMASAVEGDAGDKAHPQTAQKSNGAETPGPSPATEDASSGSRQSPHAMEWDPDDEQPGAPASDPPESTRLSAAAAESYMTRIRGLTAERLEVEQELEWVGAQFLRGTITLHDWEERSARMASRVARLTSDAQALFAQVDELARGAAAAAPETPQPHR